MDGLRHSPTGSINKILARVIEISIFLIESVLRVGCELVQLVFQASN